MYVTPVFSRPGDDKTPYVPDRKAIRNKVVPDRIYEARETQHSPAMRFSFSSLWTRELARSRPG